jgi:hypothetical protein
VWSVRWDRGGRQEAHRSDWLVARFDDPLDPEERLFAREALDGTWQSEVD